MAVQGTKDDLSQPSTASNYPDVMYVHKASAEAVNLSKVGFATLPLPRMGSGMFGNSDHKPIFLSLVEGGQQLVEVPSMKERMTAMLLASVADMVKDVAGLMKDADGAAKELLNKIMAELGVPIEPQLQP